MTRSTATNDAPECNTPRGRVAFLCLREMNSEMTFFDTVAEAEAAAEQSCSDKRCEDVHHIVTRDGDQFRTSKGRTKHKPRVPDAFVIPGGGHRENGYVSVDCPFCAGAHNHAVKLVGTNWNSPCGGGPYRIRMTEETNP
jgi:hypothetical protein